MIVSVYMYYVMIYIMNVQQRLFAGRQRTNSPSLVCKRLISSLDPRRRLVVGVLYIRHHGPTDATDAWRGQHQLDGQIGP